MSNTARTAEQILRETQKIILGKEHEIKLIITAILADGHVLLEDLPGVGKTTLVKTLSLALGCQSRRVQFVPDLLPSDICGMKIYNQKTGDFQLIQGPVMTNLLLADEINRAIPRTQSALLEAMEERQVTIDGETSPLPSPFLVLATQNPVEAESTFRLPAAQLDRFLVCLSLGYPQEEEEIRMLQTLGDGIPYETVQTVTNAPELTHLQKEAAAVHVSDAVAGYIVALTQATRSHKALSMGASPRWSRSLYRAAKVWAAIHGRDYVMPEDVQTLVQPVLAHRLVLTGEARFAGKTAASVLQEILAGVEVPPSKEELFRGR